MLLNYPVQRNKKVSKLLDIFTIRENPLSICQ